MQSSTSSSINTSGNDPYEPPSIQVSGSGGSLTVRINGRHYQKSNLSSEEVREIEEAAIAAKQQGTKEAVTELEALLNPTAKLRSIGVLSQNEEDEWVLQGTRVPLPDSILERLVELHDRNLTEDAQAVVNFWKRSLLNPNETARDGFFQYCIEHGITFTSEGYAVLYKAVNENEGYDMDADLIDFVGRKWLPIKRSGERPTEFYVIELKTVYPDGTFDDSYHLVDVDQWDEHPDPEASFFGTDGNGEVDAVNHGTLKEVYDSAATSSEGRFEPGHTQGDYGQVINLGEPVSMPREKCDPNVNKSCSKGLHVGSFDYVDRFGRNMDTILAMLVDPRDIVALPTADNSKLRTCLYTPYAIMRQDEASWEEIEEVTIQDDTIIEESDMIDQFEDLVALDDEEQDEVEIDQEAILRERLKEAGVDTDRIEQRVQTAREEASSGGYVGTQQARTEEPDEDGDSDDSPGQAHGEGSSDLGTW